MRENEYSPELIQYIEGKQKQYLKQKFGSGFEKKISEIFDCNESFLNFIERQLKNEFPYDDEARLELEALLKKEALTPIRNLTKYEFPPHKRLLNFAEDVFSLAIKDVFDEKIPYSATLYSTEVSAEIIQEDFFDKPIIFFHGELFTASLLLSKLFVQLIPYRIEEKSENIIFHSDENAIQLLLKPINQRVADFYYRYISNSSQKASDYLLSSTIQNSVLYQLLESISLFIYSHEVAHASYFHFNGLSKKTKEEKWYNENEADLYAINRVFDLYRKKEEQAPFSLIGPILFLKYLVLEEGFKPELAQIDSHPPSSERLKLYYTHLFNLLSSREKQNIVPYLTIESNISMALMDSFKDVHDNG